MAVMAAVHVVVVIVAVDVMIVVINCRGWGGFHCCRVNHGSQGRHSCRNKIVGIDLVAIADMVVVVVVIISCSCRGSCRGHGCRACLVGHGCRDCFNRRSCRDC